MVSLKFSVLASLATIASVQAHMTLHYPPAFGAPNNPNTKGPGNPRLDDPYNCCGRKTVFPCQGYLNLLGTDEGRPVATWEAGSKQHFSLEGRSTHWGGSCQAGFSVDQGKTWQVATSWEGACPHREGKHNDPETQKFEFTVPDDIPAGDQIFAWTWINREQEFFMTCSPITITHPGGGNQTIPGDDTTAPGVPGGEEDPEETPGEADGGCSSPPRPRYHRRSISTHSHRRHTHSKTKKRAVAFQDRPSFLVANIGNGCQTPRNPVEVRYPNPGPNVVTGDGANPLGDPFPLDQC
ncbi:hypothetical protein FQN57_000166 [Myotisia sp. PD_48]|nr:hypothetical protein FQN57_000166 [Myotisia sp. PD_48]